MESFTLGLMRGDGAPLYRQLYRHIVEEIASGGLAAGEKLPSKRRLAADLRVSVSTVETAYQMLVAEGYIAARAKAASRYAALKSWTHPSVRLRPRRRNRPQSAGPTISARAVWTLPCFRSRPGRASSARQSPPIRSF